MAPEPVSELPSALQVPNAPRRQVIKDVITYAIPVIIGTLSHTVLDVADTLMVGRLGEQSLAAVGLASFAALIAVVILGAIQVGTQALAGRRIGEGRPAEAGKVLDNALVITLLAGIPATALGYLGSDLPFLAARDRAVSELASSYFAIRALGFLPNMALFTFRGFFFGVGHMRFSMWLMVGVNLLNVALNYILIFGLGPIPEMGTDGAAWATTIALAAGMVTCLIAIQRPIYKSRFRALHPSNLSSKACLSISRISLPRVFQALALTCFPTFIALLEQVGTTEAAAANIIFKVHSLPFHMALGTGLAAGTLISQSLGAGRPDMAERYGHCAAVLGFLCTGAMGVVFALLGSPILGLFSTSDAIVSAGLIPFILVALTQGIDALGIIYARALHGAGDTLWVLGAELTVAWGIFVPLAWLLAKVLAAPVHLIWLAYVAYMVSFAVASWWRFRSCRWQAIEI